jgi:YD repeat-containing protein
VTYGYTYGAGPSYDLNDQVRSITYPNGVGTVTQSWNGDGTLASVTDWNGKQTTFGYDADQNQTGQTSPSTTNVTDTFGYNAADEMSSVSEGNGTTLFSATYTLDGNGLVWVWTVTRAVIAQTDQAAVYLAWARLSARSGATSARSSRSWASARASSPQRVPAPSSSGSGAS